MSSEERNTTDVNHGCLLLTKQNKMKNTGVFNDVNASIKEQIAGLKNIKIHFEEINDFESIQNISLSIRILELYFVPQYLQIKQIFEGTFETDTEIISYDRFIELTEDYKGSGYYKSGTALKELQTNGRVKTIFSTFELTKI